MAAEATQTILSVRDLSVSFKTDDGILKAVDKVSFDLNAGETLGIVGESGSGKSVTAMAILGLLPRTATISGEVLFRGESLLGRPESELRRFRGNNIAMVFQDALASLNPVMTIGKQIVEAIEVHDDKISAADARTRVIDLLEIVGIPEPSKRVDQYPHEFSGGMRQRAMIAMSIANEPDVLIADEPTTALDVTIQAQVMEVFERIQDRTKSSILLITHDLGVVAGVADRVMVMYAGRQVELGTVDDVYYRTAHPYAQGLLASLPRLDRRVPGERLHRIKGQPPSCIFLPPGCSFNPRCPHFKPGICDNQRPEMHRVGFGHTSACHFASELMVKEAPL
jgi:oligopeptide/dipeptide ABC transporter ATP-binding protein